MMICIVPLLSSILPAHVDKVWCEGNSHVLTSSLAQALLNLGHVAVLSNAVAVDALSDLTVEVGLLGSPASSRDTCSAARHVANTT